MYRKNRIGIVAALASVVWCGCAFAQPEPPATQPSDDDRTMPEAREGRSSARAERSGGRWGFAPYNRLSNITEEQKQKISEIRRKANADRKAIEEREEADIMALLTDEQKAELDKLDAERKAREGERRRAARDRDKPAGGGQDKDKEKDDDK